MANKTPLCLQMILLALGSVLALPVVPVAQSPAREAPKIKNFGSSLKRLRWDQSQNAAIESGPKRDQPRRSNDDVSRAETSLVVCDVMVTDKLGQSIEGLTAEDFTLTEDGIRQQISTFMLGNNPQIRRSIVLIIDYHFSRPWIDESVEAAKIFVDQLDSKDRMAVVTDDVKLLADFTQDKHKLKSKLESLKAKASVQAAELSWSRGHGFPFSALMASMRELFSNDDMRPIIIFQTDGIELGILQPLPTNLSLEMKSLGKQFSLADVYREAERSRATIYSVYPGIRLIGYSEAEQTERGKRIQIEGNRAIMNESKVQIMTSFVQESTKRRLSAQTAVAGVAAITNGWTNFLEAPSQAAQIYSRILLDVNRRYIVGYYPINKEHNGKKRNVKVEVPGHSEYVVLGSKSYFASGPND